MKPVHRLCPLISSKVKENPERFLQHFAFDCSGSLLLLFPSPCPSPTRGEGTQERPLQTKANYYIFAFCAAFSYPTLQRRSTKSAGYRQNAEAYAGQGETRYR